MKTKLLVLTLIGTMALGGTSFAGHAYQFNDSGETASMSWDDLSSDGAEAKDTVRMTWKNSDHNDHGENGHSYQHQYQFRTP